MNCFVKAALGAVFLLPLGSATIAATVDVGLLGSVESAEWFRPARQNGYTLGAFQFIDTLRVSASVDLDSVPEVSSRESVFSDGSEALSVSHTYALNSAALAIGGLNLVVQNANVIVRERLDVPLEPRSVQVRRESILELEGDGFLFTYQSAFSFETLVRPIPDPYTDFLGANFPVALETSLFAPVSFSNATLSISQSLANVPDEFCEIDTPDPMSQIDACGVTFLVTDTFYDEPVPIVPISIPTVPGNPTNPSVSPVPLPASLGLMVLGLGALGVSKRRRLS